MRREAQPVPNSRIKPKPTSSGLRNPVIPANQTWKCVECHFILGYSNQEKTELRIKFKDQYITVIKAERIDCVCRRCAKLNSVASRSE